MKKYFLLILIGLWIFLIFLFSSQNAATSMKITTSSIETVLTTTEKLEKNDSVEKQAENKEKQIDFFITPIRKSAHFFEYMVLGILIFLFFKECKFSLKRIIIGSLLFCVFYACTDEFHQLFVDGRTARLLDILIDCLGASLGVLLTWLLIRKKDKYENCK